MSKPIIVVGGGGHAKVLINCLLLQHRTIIGITECSPDKIGQAVLGVPIIGEDDVILRYDHREVVLVNGIGSIRLPGLRQQIYERFKQLGYFFESVTHPSAIIATDVCLAEGAQIMAGAVIQPGCRIGANSIINTRTSIDHDAEIGAHVHVAPGVTLSGMVHIGDGSHIGSGATVIQGVTIGCRCLVAAGAVVIRTVSAGKMVKGIPALEG